MSPSRREHESISSLEQALAETSDDAANLEEQRNRLAAALGELRQGVIVVDADGDEVFRNAAAERYRDARHADAVVGGATSTRLLAEACRGVSERQGAAAVRAPASGVAAPRVPAVRRRVARSARPSFVHDVSELHRIESVRRDFVANVSHELKTPIGALELLAETLAAESDPAVTRPLAERMVKEAERLGRIVDDLLDLSLIETQESPSREPVPIEVLLDEAVDRVQPAAAAAGIGLQVGHGRRDAILVCDRRQVVSAITNLLDNAVKYSEPGSTVQVETAVERRPRRRSQ